MASSSQTAPKVPKAAKEPTNPQAEDLYRYCVDKIDADDDSIGKEMIFRQDELLNRFFGDEHSDSDGEHLNKLLATIQYLIDDRRFKVVQDIDGMGWRIRSTAEAETYRKIARIGKEYEIVYQLIDEAGNEGIWQRNIKNRSQIHDVLVNKIIEKLKNKYIKRLNSVEHKTHVIWIKIATKASERVIGGAWHSDGDLDTAFVEGICSVILNFLKERSFYPSKEKARRSPKKTIKRSVPYPPPKGKTHDIDIEDSEKAQRIRKYESLLSMPANFDGYPSVERITQYVYQLGVTKDTVLEKKEIKQVLDIMILDGDVEQVVSGTKIGYKATRKALRKEERIDVASVYNEAPCGRCPVFDVCEEGGPVAPSSCQYLQEWLE
ncbi:hypothetical protein HYALB_00001330 [Hymenoscyphus albidus]|uniref:DNA-directed RNA polymerase III subunit RPC6 n=1 Tax=Hymenoscyphus albidus TaxID=595503 RepID=A0A9N9LGV8_9HELO|nr:hypothetical protein HYALB_00001330 [Hymenoscyphus albidus]